ncbi:MAG: DMT family transporter [Pseudomonadota bacterium]
MEIWIVFSLVAALAQSLRFAVQKVLAAGALSPAAATWARFLWSWPLAIGLVACYVRLSGADWPAITPHFLAFGLAGGVFQILATICTVSLFHHRAFAVGITFKKTEVMLTALVGYVILGDVIPAWGAAAIALGFVGVLLLSEPPSGGGIINRAAGIGVLSGVLFALSAVTYRGAALALNSGDPILTGGITLAVVAAWQTLVLWFWLVLKEPGQVTQTLRAWRPTLTVSLFSLIGSWSWFAAFSLMNAAYVFAVGQVELVFSLVIGWVWFGERLTAREGLGIVVLAISILSIAFLV